MKLLADNPIQSPSHDLLERQGGAFAFARDVLALDANEGVVVGVFGPWGSGKTSFVNMACTHFKEQNIEVIQFNPWLFSGADQLVNQFFFQLSSNLRSRKSTQIGKLLEDYADALSGGHSHVRNIAVFLKIIIRFFNPHYNDPIGIKNNIQNMLRERTEPIIVVLDDVDRLSTAEIRDIFKLVRLTANLPNLIYIVVCDRLHVETALQDQRLAGRDYLKKIIQFPFDLPELPRNILRGQIQATIRDVLGSDEHSYARDAKIPSDVHDRIIEPLVRNMRDLRQYAAGLHGTLVSVDGKVDLGDLLALEAVRIFLPDVFKRFPGALSALTLEPDDLKERVEQTSEQTTEDASIVLRSWFMDSINGLVESGGPHKEVVRLLIDAVFPAASAIHQMRDEEAAEELQRICTNQEKEVQEELKRRVSYHDNIRNYLERR